MKRTTSSATQITVQPARSRRPSRSFVRPAAIRLVTISFVDDDGTCGIIESDGSTGAAVYVDPITLETLFQARSLGIPAVVAEGEDGVSRIMGLLHVGLTTPKQPPVLDLSAEDQLTLRCGKASITLAKSGKITLRGTYLLSRSSGVNKIHGTAIHLD